VMIARSLDVIRRGTTIRALTLLILLLGAAPALALDPSLEVDQYGHTAWTARNGFSVGAIFAMAQTPDGYLWLGSEFGLFRFDGVEAVPWQPPAGQQLPDRPYALLVSRDGTLWIGTFAGLVSWNGDKLTRYPETGDRFVTSLLEDREGTVWAGLLGTSDPPTGQLCAIRSGRAQCDLQGGAFGTFVWSLFEDRAGTLWAGAESGVWRWRPGSPRRLEPGMRIGDLTGPTTEMWRGERRRTLRSPRQTRTYPIRCDQSRPPVPRPQCRFQ
jgi:ligand-binding sensor domain-containing protein